MTNGTSSTLTPDLPATQVEFMAALMSAVPKNQLGLPEGIYRPDLLPSPGEVAMEQKLIEDKLINPSAYAASSLHTPEEGSMSEELVSVPPHSDIVPVSLTDLAGVKIAYTSLDYKEGFPTLDGVPFWIQLNFEPPEAYRCFDLYLKQGASGARQIYTLQDSVHFPQGTNITQQDLHDYAEIYFWTSRAKAYDMFNTAHRRKERERRAIECEDTHYLTANRLLSIATSYLDEQEDELIELMTPKTLLDFIRVSSQLARVSVGLPGNGPTGRETNGENAVNPGASMELIMRSIAKEIDGNIVENSLGDGKQEHHNKMQEVLKDPAMLQKAQELILKINQPATIEHKAKPEMETI